MQPLRVVAELAGELASTPPQLDALAECLLAARFGGRADGLPSLRGMEVERPGVLPIPIERQSIHGLPVALASAPIYRPRWERQTHYTRRLSSGERTDWLAPSERKVISSASGEHRSYRLPLQVSLVPRVVWFCRGDAEGLRELLAAATHIGKKTSQGFGRVACWRVEPTDLEAWWYVPHGDALVLMRALPWGPHLPERLMGYARDFGGCVGPYWQRAFWRELVVPC